MTGYAYYNGKVGHSDDINIPLTDRLIYFGDGVYDVIIGHNKKLFMQDEHLDRFMSNMTALHFPHCYNKLDLYEIIRNMIELCGYDSYIVYLSASRNANERIHSYLSSDKINLLVTISRFCFSDKNSLKLISEEDRRYCYCNIKTTNLLPAVLYSSLAEKSGCDEAVLVRDGVITECAHSNIFMLKNETLFTHPISNVILPGITRKLLIDEAIKMGIRVKETTFDLNRLMSADEIIVSSTTKLIKNTLSVDNIPVGGKGEEIFLELQYRIKNAYDTLWKNAWKSRFFIFKKYFF